MSPVVPVVGLESLLAGQPCEAAMGIAEPEPGLVHVLTVGEVEHAIQFRDARSEFFARRRQAFSLRGCGWNTT